jgi:hypothetical protein
MTIPNPVAYTRAQRYQSGLSIVNILIICGFLCCVVVYPQEGRPLGNFFSVLMFTRQMGTISECM